MTIAERSSPPVTVLDLAGNLTLNDGTMDLRNRMRDSFEDEKAAVDSFHRC